MKYPRIILAGAHLLALVVVGCSGNTPTIFEDKLTIAKAQKTIDLWLTNGKAKVNGVQDLPQNNTARADLTLQHFNFQQGSGFAQENRDYSGSADATFTHYNDGRWVLSRVEIPPDGRFGPASWNHMNLEVSVSGK
jgi:hypothetical protein